MVSARPRWGVLTGGFITGAVLMCALVGEFWVGIVLDHRDDRAIKSLPAGCGLLPDPVAGRWLPGSRAEVLSGHGAGWTRECRWRPADRSLVGRSNPTLRLTVTLTGRDGSRSARARAQEALYGPGGVGGALTAADRTAAHSATARTATAQPAAGGGAENPGAATVRLYLSDQIGDEAVTRVGRTAGRDETEITVYVRKANARVTVRYHLFRTDQDVAVRIAQGAAREAVNRL